MTQYLYLMEVFQLNLPQYSSCERALLKRFSRSEVKVVTKKLTYNGVGIHFNDVIFEAHLFG